MLLVSMRQELRSGDTVRKLHIVIPAASELSWEEASYLGAATAIVACNLLWVFTFLLFGAVRRHTLNSAKLRFRSAILSTHTGCPLFVKHATPCVYMLLAKSKAGCGCSRMVSMPFFRRHSCAVNVGVEHVRPRLPQRVLSQLFPLLWCPARA